jgi:hypothetical protein
MVAAIAIVPASFSYRLVQSAPDDTQIVVKRIAASLAEPTVWAAPATARPARELAKSAEVIENWPGYIVVSEPFAELYLRSRSLPDQYTSTRQRAETYVVLMQRPALVVRSKAGSYAFRNVPQRIIALSGDPHALEQAAEQFASVPDIQLEFVPGKSAAEPGGS